MRRLTPLLVLILTLAFAGQARAKEIVALKVCGASDCRSTTDPQLIQAVNTGNQSIPPGAKAPWFRVEARMRIEGAADERFTLAVAPGMRMLRGGDPGAWYWMLLSKEDARAFAGLMSGVEPLPADELRGTGPPVAAAERPPAQEGADEGGLPVSLAGLALAVPLGGAALLLWRRRGGSSRAGSP